MLEHIKKTDKEVYEAIVGEIKRQKEYHQRLSAQVDFKPSAQKSDCGYVPEFEDKSAIHNG